LSSLAPPDTAASPVCRRSSRRNFIEAHGERVVIIPFEPAGFDVDTEAAFSL
jgi:hypothetical protein